jgi:uncharacterized protein (TIGR02757 family)
LSQADQEALSFILSGLSYGRVEQIKTDFFKLLDSLSAFGIKKNGAGLVSFLKSDFSNADLLKQLGNWKHRLNTSTDIVHLFETLRQLYKKHASLVECFHSHSSLENALNMFSENFPTSSSSSKKWTGTGASWWAPAPKDGGACKKILMWLRWLVRQQEPDLGIWANQISSSKLFVPLDTHILNWAFKNRLVTNKTPSWKKAKKVTSIFLELYPEDPLRCDYLICHAGMTEYRKSRKLKIT